MNEIYKKKMLDVLMGEIREGSGDRTLDSIASGLAKELSIDVDELEPIIEEYVSEEMRAVLEVHWLSGIECNHSERTDKASCSCGWSGDWEGNVGAAVGTWIAHVTLSREGDPMDLPAAILTMNQVIAAAAKSVTFPAESSVAAVSMDRLTTELNILVSSSPASLRGVRRERVRAAMIVEKAFEESWVVQDTLDRIRRAPPVATDIVEMIRQNLLCDFHDRLSMEEISTCAHRIYDLWIDAL